MYMYTMYIKRCMSVRRHMSVKWREPDKKRANGGSALEVPENTIRVKYISIVLTLANRSPPPPRPLLSTSRGRIHRSLTGG